MRSVSHLFPLILAVTLLVRTSLAADASPTPNFVHEARVLCDLSRLDFASIDIQRDGNIAAFEILAIPINEAEHHQLLEAYRKLGVPVTPWPVTATPVGVLAGTVSEGPRHCVIERPRNSMYRVGPIRDQFYNGMSRVPSAFTAVGRLAEGRARTGRNILEDLLLIPDGWATAVKPALNGWRVDRAAFANPKASKNQERLRELSRGKNPILAVLAYRTLAEAGQLGLRDLTERDAVAADARGIAGIFFLLRHTPPGEAADVADALGQRVDAATSPRELYGFAVACALDVEQPQTTVKANAAVAQASFRLSKRIEARAAKLRSDGKPDEYLEQALGPTRRVERLIEFRDRRARDKQ